MSAPYRFVELYFEGRWQAGGAAPIAVHDPWSGETIATIAAADRTDVDRAFRAAAHAQPGWAATLPGERAAVFARAAASWKRGRQRSSTGSCARRAARSARPRSSGGRCTTRCSRPRTLPSRVEGRILFGDYRAKENLHLSQAGRRGLGHQPVELAAAPQHALGRACARARQRGRHQASGRHADHRRTADREDLRGSRDFRPASSAWSPAARAEIGDVFVDARQCRAWSRSPARRTSGDTSASSPSTAR